MFVDIENFKSVIAVENILTPYQKGRVTPDKKSRLPKEHITPQVCMQILKSTNNPVNIKHMLECIKHLPQAEQAKFKEIILATFTQREQPQAILDLGKELAIANGFERELDVARKIKEGDFLLSSSKLARGLMTRETQLSDKDFSSYDKLVATAMNVYFHGDGKLPEILEFPNAQIVDLSWCNMQGVRKITANEQAKICLDSTWNLGTDVEFGACKEILVSNYDKAQFERWKYPHNALTFYSYEDLEGEVDLSLFHKVDMQVLSCKDVSDMRFAEGADVHMSGVVNLPKKLDFSQCSEVVLNDCDLSNVNQIIFKNRAQMQESKLVLPKKWKGRISFKDELDDVSKSQKNTSLGGLFGKVFTKDGR